MALSNFKKLATTTLDGKEYMFAIYEDGVEYAPGDTVMVSGATREITIERIISVEELEPNVKIRAEVIAKIEKSALAAYKHREENRRELQSLNSKINNMITCMRREDPDYEYYAAKNPDLAILLERKNYLDTVMKAGK